jgi:hypothetical protein
MSDFAPAFLRFKLEAIDSIWNRRHVLGKWKKVITTPAK